MCNNIMNKSDVTCQNTLRCLDQYMFRRLRLWKSQDHEVVKLDKYVQRMETEKQLGPWRGPGKWNYYVFALMVLYYSYGQIINWNFNP